MIFMCIMDYADKNEIKRVRPKHQAYLEGLVDAGKCISAGSFLPNDDGGLFLYEAGSLEEAQRLVDDDPYLHEGVILRHQLREYEVHAVNSALLRTTG